MLKHNDQLRRAAEDLIGIITSKYQNIVDDMDANAALGKLKKIISNYGVGAATSIEEE